MAKRILIVEDDADLRRLYRGVLQFSGFEIHEAADGVTALHLLEQYPPDLVVLDLMLPTLSGHAIQQEVARGTPIVIVTGSTEPIDHACVLRKPVTPEKLLQTVQSCLASGARAAHS